MPELTSPAASTIAMPIKAPPPSTIAPNSPNQGGFCQVLNDKKFKIVAKDAKDGERQDDADNGKDLPEKDKGVDPALAWLFGAPTIVLPVPTPAPTPPVVTTDASLTLDGAGAAAEVKPAPVDMQGACDVVDIAKPRMFTLPITTPADQPDATPVNPLDTKTPALLDPKPVVQPDATPQPIKLPPLPPRLPLNAASNPVPTAALPALFALSMTANRTDRDDNPISTLTDTASIAPLSQATSTLPIAPMADAQRQMLDMGRQDWPQKMIDHIEALRDNANANDTSIRLKPEALGRVDIALKTHNDGAISVRFSAEQPTTRTLLVDATPQLSAAAEARGIRLSGTSVDLSGQGDQRPQPQTERTRPTTNRLADVRADDNQAADDGRIA